ncbi:MAG: SPOR domain-containing protein [Myxococcales bacterium]|nr:SPOR domain-containing protein [Myxococcales bacterium]
MPRRDPKQQHSSIRLEKQHIAAVVILAVLGLTGAFYAGLAIGLRSQTPETPLPKESSSALLPEADNFKMPDATFTYDRALTAKAETEITETQIQEIPQAAIAAAEAARKAPPRQLDTVQAPTQQETEQPRQTAPLPALLTVLKQQGQQGEPKTAEESEKELQYSLQIKAFRSEDDAKALSNQLRENGYEAWVSKTVSQDKGTWYRVRIGMFKTASEAEKYQKIFEAKEGMTTLVSTH